MISDLAAAAAAATSFAPSYFTGCWEKIEKEKKEERTSGMMYGC